MNALERNKCFEKLDWLLSNMLLDTEHDDPRTPGAEEFMLMSHENGVLAFKHIGTRNYLYIYPGNKLYVPKTKAPFMLGFFDDPK